MADLLLEEVNLSARSRKSLSVHRDILAGTLVKLEVGNDDIDIVVPAGKSWDIQVSVVIDETDV